MLDTRYTGIFVRVIDGTPLYCWMSIQENGNPTGHIDLELSKAQKLMWELKKAGGDRGIEMDNINPKSYCYYVSHMFFWYH